MRHQLGKWTRGEILIRCPWDGLQSLKQDLGLEGRGPCAFGAREEPLAAARVRPLSPPPRTSPPTLPLLLPPQSLKPTPNAGSREGAEPWARCSVG